MSSRRRGAAGAVLVAFLAAGAFSHTACHEVPHFGGQCESHADCQSDYQNVPGAGCINKTCQCLDSTHRICCERGEVPPDCFLACRPCSECALGTEGCPTGCQSDDQCPGPPDPRCGRGRCLGGECTLEVKPGPLASQKRGDCQQVECSVTGEVVTIEDPSDYYDDGRQCTFDSCSAGTPKNEPVANGVTCPNAGAGICYEGECVECAQQVGALCSGGKVCTGNLCVPAHCDNNLIDPAETDFNCGGPCRPCPAGAACLIGADCIDAVCVMGICKLPLCSDDLKNDAETGLDCGAPSCPLCPPGQGCLTGDDCASGVCWAGVCETPTCIDGVRNGQETGVDCGGPCGACP